MSEEKLNVVAGVITRFDGTINRLLLIQRLDSQTYPGCWCVPGGKVEEKDGSYVKALKRELEQEILVRPDDVTVSELLTIAETETSKVHYYRAELRDWREALYNEDAAQGSGWFCHRTLKALPMTPGDEQIRDQLLKLLEVE